MDIRSKTQKKRDQILYHPLNTERVHEDTDQVLDVGVTLRISVDLRLMDIASTRGFGHGLLRLIVEMDNG
jgi:hypothetical protein